MAFLKTVFRLLCLQVNGTEIEYEFEEITLERVSVVIFPQRWCAWGKKSHEHQVPDWGGLYKTFALQQLPQTH